MNVSEAIAKRRALRYLRKAEIKGESREKLIRAARLAPSCFNNQPWNYVFVHEASMLENMKEAYSKGNSWAEKASMVVVVTAKKEDDCVIKDREYYLYDSGISAGFLMLQATELGLVAHPIAGYSQKKVRELLSIPAEYKVINLIIIGSHDPQAREKPRPERKRVNENFHLNSFKIEGKENVEN